MPFVKSAKLEDYDCRSFTVSKILQYSLFVFVCLGLLSSCKSETELVIPRVELPTYIAIGRNEGVQTEIAWWQRSRDPELVRLLQAGLSDNLTLQSAVERVAAAKAQVAITAAALYPQVSSAPNAGRARYAGTMEAYQTTATFTPSLSWTIDVWGRVRREVDGYEALVQGAEQSRRAAVLTVVTSIAESYTSLRASQASLAVTTSTVAKLRSGIEKMKASPVPAPAYAQAQVEATADQIEAMIPDQKIQIEIAENQLRLLCSNPFLKIAPAKIGSLPHVPYIPSRFSSDLLYRRPDVGSAEANLRAAYSAWLVTETLRLPQFIITANAGIGFNNVLPGPLPAGLSPLWSFLGALAAPIFDGGAISGQIDDAQAKFRDAVAQYKQAVLGAYTDAQNAVVVFRQSASREQALARAEASLEKATNLTLEAYEKDANQLVNLILAQSQLHSTKIALISAEKARFDAAIGVYKAMAGAWLDEAVARAPGINDTGPYNDE